MAQIKQDPPRNYRANRTCEFFSVGSLISALCTHAIVTCRLDLLFLRAGNVHDLKVTTGTSVGGTTCLKLP